jgi:endoglucanase
MQRAEHLEEEHVRDLLQRLTEAFGPSGREDQVRELVKGEISGLADSLTVTPMGSLHAIVNPQGKTRVMIAAHMDEIGLVVSHIDPNGFARFQMIGGLNSQTLVGHRARFADGIRAVIGIEDQEDWTKRARLADLYLDFGVSSAAECPVRVGEIGSFDRPFVEIGPRAIAKAMDDRVGVAVAIETMRRLRRTPHQVQFAFTVQEEVGLRGARTSAFGLDPDVGIALDVTRTGDTPKGPKMAVGLGKGPAIKVKDTQLLADPRLVDLMVHRAEAARIPYQLEVLDGGTTDAAVIQLTRAGVPSGCISIPCRYVHTPSEMVDLTDVEGAVKLLTAILSRPIDLTTAP